MSGNWRAVGVQKLFCFVLFKREKTQQFGIDWSDPLEGRREFSLGKSKVVSPNGPAVKHTCHRFPGDLGSIPCLGRDPYVP